MATKKKVVSKKKTAKKVKRVRYYGIVKPKKGAKVAWLSMENKNGWSLGFAMNDRTIWLRNVRFQSREEVERAMEGGKLVFVEKKAE